MHGLRTAGRQSQAKNNGQSGGPKLRYTERQINELALGEQPRRGHARRPHPPPLPPPPQVTAMKLD